MSKARENISRIASKKVSNWLNDAEIRQANKKWKDRSFKIAVRILREIRAQKNINGMTQRKLAEEMGVSPQYINKVVKGKENLTLETIAKIEDVLGITIIEVTSTEFGQTIHSDSSEFKSTVSKLFSIPLTEDVLSYDDPNYSKATGTYG